jgi:hypothetical protein
MASFAGIVVEAVDDRADLVLVRGINNLARFVEDECFDNGEIAFTDHLKGFLNALRVPDQHQAAQARFDDLAHLKRIRFAVNEEAGPERTGDEEHGEKDGQRDHADDPDNDLFFVTIQPIRLAHFPHDLDPLAGLALPRDRTDDAMR